MVKNKGTFRTDTFEQITEFGKSTAKNTAKSLIDTFNPLKIVESARTSTIGENSSIGDNGKTAEVNKGKGTTPLDLDKLQDKYKDQDKAKQEALRLRLFQLVKSGEERAIEGERREQEEKKQKEIYREQQKRQQEQQKRQQEQQEDIPR